MKYQNTNIFCYGKKLLAQSVPDFIEYVNAIAKEKKTRYNFF